MAARPRT